MGIAASASASAPPSPLPAEAASPVDPPPKEEPHPAAAAGPTAPEGDAAGGEGVGAGELASETVVLDAAAEAAEGGQEEEEQGECGFCLFMKGGGCEEEFVAWEKCVEQAEVARGDVVELCFDATAALRKCMDAHAEYYEPILRAERAMAEDLEAAKARELEASESSSPAPAPPPEEETDGKKQAEEKVAVLPEVKEEVAA